MAIHTTRATVPYRKLDSEWTSMGLVHTCPIVVSLLYIMPLHVYIENGHWRCLNSMPPHTQIHMQIHTRTHTHINTHSHAHTTCTHTHMHTCTYPHAHTHAHTHAEAPKKAVIKVDESMSALPHALILTIYNEYYGMSCIKCSCNVLPQITQLWKS